MSEEMIQIDLSELLDLAEKFPGVPERALELTVIETNRNLKIEAPGTNLPESIEFPIKLSGLAYGIKIGAHYWKYVNEGTGIHWIEPAVKKVLHFHWDKAGGMVFFKAVLHPGTKPNPFADRAIEATSKRIEEFVQTAMEEKGIA